MQSMRATMQAPPSQVSPAHTCSGRLKYAEPRDLPSFPSIGLRRNDSAASAAASLGWANQKPPTLVAGDQNGQRNTSTAYAAAAILAKDPKPLSLWSPAKNDAGSQAAILAATKKQEASPVPVDSSTNWGNSAATQAFKANSLKSPELSDSRSFGRAGSLRAAKDAMGRPRAVSSPGTKYTTQQPTDNRTTNALTAATMAHRRSTTLGVDRENNMTGSTSFLNMNRQMFTSHPPVQNSVEDQKHSDVLHASAVAMAKRMYKNQQQQQQQQERAADSAARLAQTSGDSSSPDASAAPMKQYNNLQEVAYKLAQERLSKLQEEHDLARGYHDYYGASAPSQASYKRFMPKNKLRRRSTSDGDTIKGREMAQRPRRATLQAAKAPRQQHDPGVIDEEKRQRDREVLLSAARRNVRAQMEGIDRKVIAETGMVSPFMKAEWEVKAQALARSRSHPEFMAATTPGGNALGIDRKVDGKQATPAGKVDIGGGKYMDQSEIDEIAARRVQPFLDEINQKAEKERERLGAIKAEKDAKHEAEVLGRMRQQEVKELHEKIKNQQKQQENAQKEEVKNEEREKKRLGKEIKMEQKRDAKYGQGHSHFLSKKVTDAQVDLQEPADTSAASAEKGDMSAESALEPVNSKQEKPHRGRSLHLRLPSIPLSSKPKEKGKEREPHSASAALPSQSQSPVEDNSPTSAKVKNWLKSRFRPRARSSAEQGSFGSGPKKGGFIGGAALAAQHHRAASDGSRESIKEESIREVALAGRNGGVDQATLARTATGTSSTFSGQQQPRQLGGSSVISLPGTAQSTISSLSSSSSSTRTGGEHFVLAKDHVSPAPGAAAAPASSQLLSPPPKLRDPNLRATKSGSPVRDSRFLEMMDN